MTSPRTDHAARTSTPPALLVGAYAAEPTTPQAREQFYRQLATLPGVRGLELPMREDLGGPDGLATLAARLAPAWDRCVVTAVPATMVRVWADPTFGLASVDRAGRQAAIALTRQVRDAVERLREAAGRDVVAAVELHSAPSGPSGTAHLADAFGESLATVADWDWGGAELLVEHCDAYVAPDHGEKRLLSLAEEVDVVTALNRPDVRLSLNWGRSALEAHDAAAAAEHVRFTVSLGLLAGITFSGAGPVDTPYAAAWMDGHLPLADDEPGSAMTAQEVRTCTEVAMSAPTPPWYLGAKCQVPAQASPAERVELIGHILAATGHLPADAAPDAG